MHQTDWRLTHASKLTSAEEAIRLVRPGRRILIGSGAAEPVALVEALVRADHLADNEIVHLLTLGPAPYVRPEFKDRFRHTAFFIGANVRDAVQQGRADFLPVFLSEIPELIRRRRVRIDVALIQVSPPDAHGFVSLGVSVDVVRAAVEMAELVIAEVNQRMPRTHGDSFVHVSRLDRLVAVDAPLLEHAVDPPGEVEREIGRLVATLVPDGATLQTGIGRIPDAVLDALSARHDLGVHTEMLSDGMMRLFEAGVVTGRRKALRPGKMVTSFVMGSRALYEWVHDNPAIEMQPSDVTNDPWVIAQHDRMVAINSALAVDLTGQVASDTLMGKFFSGIGGQVDFVRGAARSRDGKAILALPSTAKGGAVSRIQPILEQGAGVVTSRGDVRYVVTEYGIAELWGKNVRQRALALISIAHPQFRAELLQAAKERRYVFPEQVVPRASRPFTEERREQLLGGGELVLRPVRITDEESLLEFLHRCPEREVIERVLVRKGARLREELRDLADIDEERSMALVAVVPATGEVVGMARYDMDPATRLGDVVFIVREDWRGRGVGTLLLRRMIDVARACGLAGFRAEVERTNEPMLMAFYRSGLALESSLDGGTYRIRASFAATP